MMNSHEAKDTYLNDCQSNVVFNVVYKILMLNNIFSVFIERSEKSDFFDRQTL